MANVAISALPAATSLTGTDTVPVVQGGITKKATLSQAPVSTAQQAALDAKSDVPTGYLSTLNTISELPLTTALEPAGYNFFYNSFFKIWPHGYTTVAIPAAGDNYTAGGWIGAAHSGPATTSSLADANKGGITQVMGFTAAGQYHYVRQFVQNVIGMSRGTFTMIADVTTDGTIKMDAYVQARVNANDLDRELVVDSSEITLTGAGRRYVAVSFTSPDLWDNSPTWDDRNMLEAAWRFVSTASGTRTCTIHSVAMVPGRVAKKPSPSNPAIDQATISAYYESGFASFVGLNTASGQKRCQALYKVKKALPVVAGDIVVKDLVGNVGKVSTYDVAGTRTDNVAYTAIGGDTAPTYAYQDGFVVIINGSTAAGVSYQWTVNNY